MGFFDRLFGKKKDNSKSTSIKTASNRQQNSFICNSEDFGLGPIDLKISGKVRVDGILAIAAFDKIAKQRNLEVEYEVMYVTLLEEGALTVPVVIKMGEERYSLYFIYQEEDLLKYKDLTKHVGRTAYPKLIHFSAIPIYEGYEPKPIIEPFQLADLRVDKDAKVSGPYAMWWASEEEKTFHDSPTCEHLKKLYDVFQGYESYLLGYVLRQVRVVSETQLQRMAFPEGDATFILAAPEGKKVVLTVSQEKGIRFLFPIENTTVAYRERFLRGALVDFLATRVPLQQHNLPKDEPGDPNSFDWFQMVAKATAQMEVEGKNIDIIGVLNFS